MLDRTEQTVMSRNASARNDRCSGIANPVGKVFAMATGETGFDDVTFDLISVQYHSLKAGHDYGQYVRDASNAGREDIADFFREVMQQDSERGKRCHEFLKELSGTDESGPAVT
jgi:hypothetical protein